jgi:prepilin-type N-terminal cleavage/methylation domain-containing protein
MKNKQRGFSLIELMLVVVILGIVSTIAIPYLLKAVHRSEERSAFASLRTVASAQVNYLSSKGRFARLDELNASAGNGLGVVSAPNLIRGKFTFQMSPNPVPTDAALKDQYTVIASKPATGGEPGYIATVDQTGKVRQIFPIPVGTDLN